MKTSSPSFPPALHLIDTAPLAARYEVLMASVLAMISAGHIGRVLRLTHDVRHLIRFFIKFETHNVLLRRKLDMLLDKSWRSRVLKELGGMRRLKSWEAAVARNANPPANKPTPELDPIWLYTDERRAESERLKAHARKCARACISPGVVRDKIRVDFDGEFRLAPIPKGEGFARQEKIYTKASICDYSYNAMPFYEIKGFGPAMVWPAEFRAAIAAEREVAEGKPLNSVIPHEAQCAEDAGPNDENRSVGLGPGSAGFALGRDDKERCDDEAETCDVEKAQTLAIPTRSYKDFIPPKLQRRIFHPLS